MNKLSSIIVLVLWSILSCTGCAQEAQDTHETETSAQSSIRVASFNLRMDTPNDGDDAWPHRAEFVKGLIRFHQIDLLGTQEGFSHQLDEILEIGGYARIGAGRDDGEDAGEHSAIIYRTDCFDVLDHGDFWFSETPDTPSKGWDATCCNRICSWAKFRDLHNGKEFYFFSLHYDHEGKIARKNSSKLLLDKIRDLIAGGHEVIVCGDFNATPDSGPIQIIKEEGIIYDSYEMSKEEPYGPEGTINQFNLDLASKKRIDYVWVTKDIEVSRYAVLTDQLYGHFPSDHFPVVVDLVLPND